MSKMDQIEQEARSLCRHTVCFTDAESKLIAVRALQGLTTKAIARELHLSESKVQYAILKAQKSLGADIRFRRDYRNGYGPLAKKMLEKTQTFALQTVRRKIAPKFRGLAANGVSRLS